MSSQSSSTRPQQPVQPAAPPARSSVNPLTLLIAAVSSAAAAYVTSKIWQSGTLVATAMTPVIVALVREALEKPAAVVTTTLGAPLAPTRARGRATAPRGEAEPTLVQSPDGGDPTLTPMTVHRTHSRVRVSRRWVRVGLVTGLLAFVIAAVIYTVPELIAGQSLGSSGKATTLFQGRSSGSSKKDKTPATTTTSTTKRTTTAPEAEPTTTVTTPAQAPTVTVTTPEPEATTPATTTPAPAATTPAPDATATTPDATAGAAP